jgi:FdhD protein
MKGVGQRKVRRVRPGAPPVDELDPVAIEEPLEIRVAQDPVAVTMRTPGDDARLTVGFLFAEGIIRGVDDVSSVAHCGRPGDEGYGNVIEVTAAPGLVLEIEKSRRGTLTTSACGVCGRTSIDDLLKRCGPVPAGAPLPVERVAAAVEKLRDLQPNFAKTGGVHAAAAIDATGAVLASAEDVGRHNAVDKVVGALLHGKKLGQAALLAVSGRASFEIVQKAAMARIPIVASVSAASSLAIDLAEKTGIALATFTRDGAFNLCTHPERVTSP